MSSGLNKIVVFDLDETLGYFKELGLLWESIVMFLKHNNVTFETQQQWFDDTIDLYPEFIRPGIEQILNYLKGKKEMNECNRVMIYTNNQGPKKWVHFIKNYFEKKIGDPQFFNQIICAFKVNGKQIELNRTRHEKSYDDLIECSMIPRNAQICFLDDTYYPDMTHENIYYIKVKPYVHNIQIDELIRRFSLSTLCHKFITIKNTNMVEYIKQYILSCDYVYIKKSKKDYAIDIVITKKILEHLHDFFQE